MLQVEQYLILVKFIYLFLLMLTTVYYFLILWMMYVVTHVTSLKKFNRI